MTWSLLLTSILLPLAMLGSELPEGVGVGDIAPNFVVKNIDGKAVGLMSFKDMKGIILIFTCNHCPYSIANEDRIIALHKAYASRGWPVLAINPNDPDKVPEDSFEKMQERAQEKGFTFPYAMDMTQNVAKAYGARRTPHVYLLQKVDDVFKVAYIGAIDDSPRDGAKVQEKFVVKALEALLGGKQPEVTTTKAIGCSIKWKE
jgi:peroxiredoxin